MANLTDKDVVDFFETDSLADGLVPGDGWKFYLGNPDGEQVYIGTLAQLRAVLAPNTLFLESAPTVSGREGQQAYATAGQLSDLYQYESGKWVLKQKGFVLNAAGTALPKPAAATFTNFQDTQSGGSVLLVPAPGVPLADYLYRVTATGNYQPAPVDGLITVDNVAGPVYAYAKATAGRQQSEVAVSNSFTAYAPPTSGTKTPAAPTFVGFSDSANTVQLVPASGVPMADYQYKLGATGTYATAPADGIISVGDNFSGQVFAYSIASGVRNVSLTGASPAFTATVVGTTTPQPPTFTGFDDTTNTVQLVPATGVPLSAYSYKLGAGGTYAAVPVDGIIVVPETFAGQVFAYSVAEGPRNASQVAGSPAFTAPPVIGTPGPPTSLVAKASTSGAPSITITGQAPLNDGGASITEYKVYRGTLLVGSFFNGGGANLSYTDEGVALDTPYTFRLSAVNSKGEGEKSVPSNTATATVPAVPSFANALNPGDNVATLTYDGSSQGVLRYNDPVQPVSTVPGANSMAIFYPNLSTQIGLLNYDPADEGHACGLLLGGVLYVKNVAGGSAAALTFTNGNVLLG